ncbi:hypothetical protein DVH24_022038 [Malus domestica]|uniref:Proteasome alpha-type subunits domain-containing protein n=2 Tax=Malus domestica TaxID=3750 RepID=A0A498IWS0_MALDO|nr:hypothetical protein DVH24_022038 [Malus domestica]
MLSVRLCTVGNKQELFAARVKMKLQNMYDSRTTIFSPEGRLYQVEYAMEAIGNAGTAIGILSKDGVVLVGEKKVTSKLLQTSTSTEKMYKIDDHVACAVAGIMSDANILINTARVQAQRYTFAYQEPMPVEQLVQSLCDTKQGYTQFGWDKNYGFQLYMSDPSGNYGGWKAAAIGANNQAAQSMLKQDYKDEITREEAVELALKVLSKTMDSTSLTSDKLELAEVFVLPSGKVKYQVCSPDALSKLLVKSGILSPISASGFTMSLLSKLRCITVDVTGTLLAYKGELGDYYCMAAKAVGLECPDYKRVHEGFKYAYKDMATKYPCFGHAAKMPNIVWWKTCVRDSFIRAGYHYDEETFEKVFRRIYASFGSSAPYSIFPDSQPFLRWVHEQGLKVGIISNAEYRYRDVILPALGVHQGTDWDFGVFSGIEGVEKPNPKIYELALKRAGNLSPDEVLHIGDSMRKDYVPATSIGMHALLLDRFKTSDADEWRKSGAVVLPDLEAAKEWLTSQKSAS